MTRPDWRDTSRRNRPSPARRSSRRQADHGLARAIVPRLTCLVSPRDPFVSRPTLAPVCFVAFCGEVWVPHGSPNYAKRATHRLLWGAVVAVPQVRIADDDVIDDLKGLTHEEIMDLQKAKTAKAQATILEIVRCATPPGV